MWPMFLTHRIESLWPERQMKTECVAFFSIVIFASLPQIWSAPPIYTIPSSQGTGYNSGSKAPTDCMRSNQCAAATYGQESKKERNHQKLCAEALRELDTRQMPGTNLKLSSCYR